MTKIILVFASLSGNTEEVARLIKKGILSHEEADLTVKDMFDVQPEILQNYDGILLGSYSWSRGDEEVPEECLDFYDDLQMLDLSGKKASVFGSGDNAYPVFCGAVDEFEQALKQAGAEIVQPGLKIDLDPIGEDRERCEAFGRNFIELIDHELKRA